MTNLQGVSRFSHHSMSTEFEIFFSGLDPDYTGFAAQEAFREIDRIESLFSRFDESSEISLINRLQPGETMLVGAEMFECLSLAAQIQQETGGAFDIRAETLLKYPQHRQKNRFPLILDSSGQGFRVTLAEDMPEAGIDLGGIGKGYALDSVHNLLEDWDAQNILIQSGTSTALAAGSADEKHPGWPVGVGGTWSRANTPRRLRLKNQALSGSGTEVKGAHIIDPETAQSAGGHLAAWAVHLSAAAADALSTAFMVMNTREVEQYCRTHAGVWALVVSKNGSSRVFNPETVINATDMEESS
jgi:thiamine biosynthesis lipoprotein